MSDRKQLVNYIHPDLDPKLLDRKKKPKLAKDGKIEVRTMLPFSLQCNSCKGYMYAGKKFNAKKEVVAGESYMGVKILRFYIRCTTCSASITFKTDPKNSNYTCEFGASRNIEGWRNNKDQEEKQRDDKRKEEAEDAMKKLENKTLSNQAEMDEMDALEEIQTINQRNQNLDTDTLISKIRGDGEAAEESDSGVTEQAPKTLPDGLTEEDEKLVRSVKFGHTVNKTLLDSDSDREEKQLGSLNKRKSDVTDSNDRIATSLSGNGIGFVITKKRKIEAPAPSAPSAISVLNGYGSDSD